MRRYLVIGACCAAAAGCGGGGTKGFHPVSVQQQKAVNGTKAFAAPQMAITFQYPARFRAVKIESVVNEAGNTKNSTIAAVGTGETDFLAVSRTPIPVALNAANLHQALPLFDSLMSRLTRQSVNGKALDLDGAAAIEYPRVPIPRLNGVTSRIIFVFVGKDRYELQCQATKSGLDTIEKACNQMVSTLKVNR
jgi:hypothetical protein